jgi:hypothetical protein
MADLTRSEPVPQCYTDFVDDSCFVDAPKPPARPGLDAQRSIAKPGDGIVPKYLAYDLEQILR